MSGGCYLSGQILVLRARALRLLTMPVSPSTCRVTLPLAGGGRPPDAAAWADDDGPERRPLGAPGPRQRSRRAGGNAEAVGRRAHLHRPRPRAGCCLGGVDVAFDGTRQVVDAVVWVTGRDPYVQAAAGCAWCGAGVLLLLGRRRLPAYGRRVAVSVGGPGSGQLLAGRARGAASLRRGPGPGHPRAVRARLRGRHRGRALGGRSGDRAAAPCPPLND